MASELLVATRSADKLKEICAILGSAGRVRLITLDEAGVPPTAAEDELESRETFIANAVAKARYFAGLTGMPTLADDSGLAVNALKGGPGVRTKRFAIDHGVVGGDTTGKSLDDANNKLLLERLAAVPDAERAAHYVCAAAFANAGDRVVTSIGTCAGMIARAPRGDGGFGYDPLFLLPDLGITFAELTPVQKNARSHRAVAFRALASHLK